MSVGQNTMIAQYISIVSAFPHAKLFSVAINSICGFMITTENDSNLPFGVLGESFQT